MIGHTVLVRWRPTPHRSMGLLAPRIILIAISWRLDCRPRRRYAAKYCQPQVWLEISRCLSLGHPHSTAALAHRVLSVDRHPRSVLIYRSPRYRRYWTLPEIAPSLSSKNAADQRVGGRCYRTPDSSGGSWGGEVPGITTPQKALKV